MSRPHWDARPDKNQSEVMNELEESNIRAWDVSTLPDSQCPGDILCYGWGIYGLFELKSEDGEPSDEQKRWADIVPIVYGSGDIVDWFAAELKRRMTRE